jgi:hypothetical protein
MYTLPCDGVQRGGTPSAGSEGAIPLARGSGGKRAPNVSFGSKPPKKKMPCIVNVYCNFIVNVDYSL